MEQRNGSVACDTGDYGTSLVKEDWEDFGQQDTASGDFEILTERPKVTPEETRSSLEACYTSGHRS